MFKKNTSILKSTTSLVGTALITAFIFSSEAKAAPCTSDCTNNETINGGVILESGYFINNGLISNSITGIAVPSNSVLTITNNGSILASDTAINIFSQSSMSGGIINSISSLI